jgi:hypothetical protein
MSLAHAHAFFSEKPPMKLSFSTSCKNYPSDDGAKFQTLIKGLVGSTIQ